MIVAPRQEAWRGNVLLDDWKYPAQSVARTVLQVRMHSLEIERCAALCQQLLKLRRSPVI